MSQETYGGRVVYKEAPETELKEFVTVHVAVYVVSTSAFGGIGPLFVKGPVEYTSLPVAFKLDATLIRFVAVDITSSGAPSEEKRVPLRVTSANISGFRNKDKAWGSLRIFKSIFTTPVLRAPISESASLVFLSHITVLSIER